jgi:hypothetical protein
LKQSNYLIGPAFFLAPEEQRSLKMKILVLGAVIAATVIGALPASAQIVVQERGMRSDRVVVREHSDRGRHEGWRRSHADCRVMRVKTRLPNGNVIIKTRRSC